MLPKTFGIDIKSFNWEAFQRLIEPPCLDLATKVLQELRARDDGYWEALRDYLGEGELWEQLATIFSSQNWYPAETTEELILFAEVAKSIFELTDLEAEWHCDSENPFLSSNVLLEIGTARRIKNRDMKRAEQVAENKTPSLWQKITQIWGGVKEDDSEWTRLGRDKFRYNRANYEHLPRKGELRSSLSEYEEEFFSVHSPQQVQTMYEEAAELDKLITEDEFIENELQQMFAKILLPTLEQTARKNRAITAFWVWP